MKKLLAEAKTYWDKRPRPVIVLYDTVYLSDWSIDYPNIKVDSSGVKIIKPKVEYIAEHKGWYNDSTLFAIMDFRSPVYLHPDSKFNLYIEQKRKLALTESGWFENRFIIYGGIGFNSFSITPTFQIGIGIRLGDLL